MSEVDPLNETTAITMDTEVCDSESIDENSEDEGTDDSDDAAGEDNDNRDLEDIQDKENDEMAEAEINKSSEYEHDEDDEDDGEDTDEIAEDEINKSVEYEDLENEDVEDEIDEKDNAESSHEDSNDMEEDNMECKEMGMSEAPMCETNFDTDGNTKSNKPVATCSSDGQDYKSSTFEYRPPIKIKMKELFKKRARPRKAARPQRVVKETKTSTDLYDDNTDEEYWYDDKDTTEKDNKINDPDFVAESNSVMNFMSLTQNINFYDNDGRTVKDISDSEIAQYEDDDSETDDEFKKYAKNLKKSYELRMAQKLCTMTDVDISPTGKKSSRMMMNLKNKFIKKSKAKLKHEKVKRKRLDRRRPHGIPVPDPILCEVRPGEPQVEMWKCDLCTKLCKNSASYIAHYKSCMEKVKTEVYFNEEGKYKCSDCGKIYELKASLQRHMRFHQGIDKYKCPICEKQFTDSKSLRGHVFIHTGEKPYKCTVCGFPFRDKSTWRKHERRHGTEKPFECETCKKRFFHGVDLRKHQKIHLVDKEYKCTECDKQFYLIGALKRHVRVHTGERPYFCSICNKAFTDTTAVRCHEQTHTNIRPFKCDCCEMTFGFKNHLDRHRRRHDKGKPYRCEFCFQEFVDKDVLMEHKTRHVGDEPYECTVCSATYTDPYVLRSHRKTHVIEKSFTCAVCGKNFSRNHTLRRHIDKIHAPDRPERIHGLKGVKKVKTLKIKTLKQNKPKKQLEESDVVKETNTMKTEVLVKDIPHMSMIQLALAGASPPNYTHLKVKADKDSNEHVGLNDYPNEQPESTPSVDPEKHDEGSSENEKPLDSGSTSDVNTAVSNTDIHTTNYWKHMGNQFAGDTTGPANQVPLFLPPHKLLSSGFSSNYQHLAMPGLRPETASLNKPVLHNVHNDMLSQLEHFRQNELRTVGESKPIPGYSDYMFRKYDELMNQTLLNKGHPEKNSYSNEVSYNDVHNYPDNYSIQPGSKHSVGDNDLRNTTYPEHYPTQSGSNHSLSDKDVQNTTYPEHYPAQSGSNHSVSDKDVQNTTYPDHYPAQSGSNHSVSDKDVQNATYPEHYPTLSGSNHSVGDVHVPPTTDISPRHQLESLDELNKRVSLAENNFKPDWNVMYSSNNC